MRSGIDTVEEFWTWDQVRTAQATVSPSSLANFRADFGRFIGTPADRIHLMPSGHQGLEWLLRVRRDPRCCVMAPAFNCSVVQDAASAAGYRMQLYDFSPRPGEFDWHRVIGEIGPSVDAVIVTHYFGVPIDFRPLLEHCAAHGIAVIEDCAHTLGGTIAGRQAGTLGDASIFSFNYDKPISLGWGGIAVINNKFAFDGTQPDGHRVPSIDEEMFQLRLFVAAMAMRRKMIPYQYSLLARILRRARLIKSGTFRKDPSLSMGAVQAELGRWCLAQYPGVQQKRSAHARALAARARQPTWPVGLEVEPAWLKQKLCITDATTLRRFAAKLQRRGLRVGNFNWPTLIGKNVQEQVHCRNAQEAATSWIDIPIHQNLDDGISAEILRILN